VINAKKVENECKTVTLKMIDSSAKTVELGQNGGQNKTKIETLYLNFCTKTS